MMIPRLWKKQKEGKNACMNRKEKGLLFGRLGMIRRSLGKRRG
jgi:hypothetical protein